MAYRQLASEEMHSIETLHKMKDSTEQWHCIGAQPIDDQP